MEPPELPEEILPLELLFLQAEVEAEKVELHSLEASVEGAGARREAEPTEPGWPQYREEIPGQRHPQMPSADRVDKGERRAGVETPNMAAAAAAEVSRASGPMAEALNTGRAGVVVGVPQTPEQPELFEPVGRAGPATSILSGEVLRVVKLPEPRAEMEPRATIPRGFLRGPEAEAVHRIPEPGMAGAGERVEILVAVGVAVAVLQPERAGQEAQEGAESAS